MESRDLLAAYVDRVARSAPTTVRVSGSRSLAPTEIASCRDWVKGLEQTPEFIKLATHQDDEVESTDCLVSWYQERLETLLRRSGFYLDAYMGNSPNSSFLVSEHERMLADCEERSIRQLAPLSSVSFPCSHIEMPHFDIRQFSQSDLDAILGNPVNEVFFPKCVVDTSEICGYWFVDVKTKTVPYHVRLSGPDPVIKKRFTRYGPALEDAFRILALWDWEGGRDDQPVRPRESGDKAKGWLKPTVPFVLTVGEDLWYKPKEYPALEPPEIGLNADETGEVYEFFCYGSDVNDEVAFRQFMREMDDSVFQLREPEGWKFLQVALGFLAKAFFAEEEEEFLWHMVTIEALLGEDPERGGLVSLLARRAATILGDVKNVKKRFYELYDLRSNLVHGNTEHLSQEMFRVDLRDARRLARETTVWFLRLLHQIERHAPPVAVRPTRSDLLRVLDMDKDSRSRLKALLDLFPESFPSFR